MIDSIVMIINKLSKEYEPLLTAFMLYFFRLKDFFILNYEVNLFVAKNFFLIFAYYYSICLLAIKWISLQERGHKLLLYDNTLIWQ